MSVVLIQLNEINFCIVKKYINKGYKLDTLENIHLKSIILLKMKIIKI